MVIVTFIFSDFLFECGVATRKSQVAAGQHQFALRNLLIVSGTR
ncbi:hypothetical protein ACPOL_1073 [Acidisarcina polymorpha]|uniref:Uncharacterized protein n=1 Tax=Acidisarcina polymorpha TaxID=2211140 RepID=A0A2Z5FV97_9BACT|nr:hypothetical protein ACPOL_1073 [Acidisarcina polymorpha]